jgi:hypothetical protein
VVLFLIFKKFYYLYYIRCHVSRKQIPDPYTSLGVCVMIMVFNATLNNISVTSLKSILLVEETGGPEENHRPVASH